VDLLSADGRARLEAYAAGRGGSPLAGFWADSDVAPGAV